MDPYQVAQNLEEWQRCLPQNLPKLFSFYSEKYAKTERVTTFKLDPSDLITLIKLKPVKLRILMGCDSEGTAFNDIPVRPSFAPILQAILADSQTYEHCFKLHYLEWKDATIIPTSQIEGLGDPGWITSDTAQLFTIAWLESTEVNLKTQFEGMGLSTTSRVRFYEYREKETQDIINTIMKFGLSSTEFLMNMGLSLPVLNHPFGFRPVIQIKPQLSALDGEGDEYFEFSNPCPPMCP